MNSEESMLCYHPELYNCCAFCCDCVPDLLNTVLHYLRNEEMIDLLERELRETDLRLVELVYQDIKDPRVTYYRKLREELLKSIEKYNQGE